MSKNPRIRIPLSIPSLGPEEEASVVACIRSGWVSTISPTVKVFEERFAAFLSAPYAAATTSGTAAIQLALLALGIGPGDEVIVPALSFVATANPVRYVGAIPVFVDIEPITFGLNPLLLQQAITPKTKAILISHLYGLPARIEEVLALANQAGIPVIEDAAEALGTTLGGKAVGTFGTVGCFSFNGNKTLTCGGGGMVVTHDQALGEKIVHLSTQAREPGLEIAHDAVGYNLRMTGLQAAMGVAQLEKLPEMLRRKREIAKTYAKQLKPLANTTTVLAPASSAPSNPSYWLSVILVRDQQQRNQVLQEAMGAGIEMRPFFKPLPLLTPYRPWGFGRYPIAEDIWHRGVCLPSSPSLTDEEQETVISKLWECLGRRTDSLLESRA